LLLAYRVAGSVGGLGDHWNFLASVACIISGNLLARYERWLFCECFQKPDISLRARRAVIFGKRDPVTFV
jgi:hypothetical protein